MMDSRIEVVNENMVVVNFGLLPLDGIHYVPDDGIGAEYESGRISDEGILVLNCQYDGYMVLKAAMVVLMRFNDKQLARRQNKLFKRVANEDGMLKNAKVVKNIKKTGNNNLNLQFVNIEVERRDKQKRYDAEQNGAKLLKITKVVCKG